MSKRGPEPGDVLEGAEEIARCLREIGLARITRRRAFYLCESGQIPAGKLGGGWVASRRTIKAHFEKLTAGRPPEPA